MHFAAVVLLGLAVAVVLGLLFPPPLLSWLVAVDVPTGGAETKLVAVPGGMGVPALGGAAFVATGVLALGALGAVGATAASSSRG